jgi:hypothetical protein
MLLVALLIAGCGADATPTPTVTPIPTLVPTLEVDPHIEISASATALQVGDTVTITGAPVDLGLPFYSLKIQSVGTADRVELALVTYINELKAAAEGCHGLAFLSAEGEMNRASFVLQACRPGAVELWINATGEVHYGYPGPATWAGGASRALQISVTE